MITSQGTAGLVHNATVPPPIPIAPPDIVMLAADWRPRALLRAQLIEEGFDVSATDSWPMLRPFLRPGSKPRLVIVDLQHLDDPGQVLRDVTALMKPERVLVLRASGTVGQGAIENLGCHVLNRPIGIDAIVAAVRALLAPSR